MDRIIDLLGTLPAWLWMVGIASVVSILGLAAMRWQWFREDVHKFNREVSQENRHAELVGAKSLPKEPIKIIIEASRDEALKIDRAEIDGDKIWVYATNTAPMRRIYPEVFWKMVGPDGTVIKQNSAWFGSGYTVDPNERAELEFTLYPYHADPRAVSLKLRIKSQS